MCFIFKKIFPKCSSWHVIYSCSHNQKLTIPLFNVDPDVFISNRIPFPECAGFTYNPASTHPQKVTERRQVIRTGCPGDFTKTFVVSGNISLEKSFGSCAVCWVATTYWNQSSSMPAFASTYYVSSTAWCSTDCTVDAHLPSSQQYGPVIQKANFPNRMLTLKSSEYLTCLLVSPVPGIFCINNPQGRECES
jgi:hypothetical protein